MDGHDFVRGWIFVTSDDNSFGMNGEETKKENVTRKRLYVGFCYSQIISFNSLSLLL